MDFYVVYGKSGTGKSKYIYEDIKKERGSKKIFLVVPEQSNLTAEQNLFKELKIDSMMDIEVLTLSRMATRVLDEVGQKSNNLLSKVGKNMIIYDILSKEKNNLKFLGKSDKNIDIVSNIITEFKKHNISIDLLNNINIEEEYTKLKLEDVKNIFFKYQEKLSQNFIDENDELTLLFENLFKVDLFKDSIIYFDDFLGFTTQEYKVFDGLIKQAEKIVVTIPSDSLFVSNKENDIFYFNKKFANKLIEIATDNGANINTVFLEKNYRAENKELQYLEEAFSKNMMKKYDEKVENIKLIASENPYNEVENTANIIFDLVKKHDYRYKDIIVISSSVDEYKDDIKSIFSKYNIPVFIDEKKELTQNILVRFIISLIDVFAKNWSFESVLNYVKIGLLDIDKTDLYEFENYCLKWGIKYKKWFEKFQYEPANDKQDLFEKIRKQIVLPLEDFKSKVSGNRTVEEITKCLYCFLIENQINVSVENKIKQINEDGVTNEYNTSYKILVKLLDELVLIFGDDKISFDRYKDLLQVGLNSSELGKIPANQDGVVFGDISRSRGSNVKVEILIGVNDGKLPSSNKVEGYFNDDDRLILENQGLELAKNSKDNMYEEQFNIYRMLTLPSDKLFILFSTSDKTGENLRPSILIKKIKKIFDLKEEEIHNNEIINSDIGFDIAISSYKDYLDGEEITEDQKNIISYFEKNENDKFKKAIAGLDYSNKAETINKVNVMNLYGNILQTSISKLEQYRECPFAFHLKYGLKINEKRDLQIRALDTGNFMHEVLDDFFNIIKDDGLNIKDLDDTEIERIVVKIINELFQTSKYYVFSSTSKFRILSRRLKKVVLDSVKYIIYTLKNSKFEVLGNEIEFSRFSEYKPIVISLEDGTKVELSGKIDRADIGKLNGKDYVRIIDYKSSVKTLDYNRIIAGLQIQLITYLDDLCIQKEFEPGGVLYMGLIDNIVKAPKNLSDDEIKEEIKKNFRMQGVILADIDIARMMDTGLDYGYSDIVPVGISKTTGDIIESKSSVLKKEDFSNLQKKVRHVIKQISKEILSGCINIKPYHYGQKTGCDYCTYKSICRFTPGIKENEYNYIQKMNKQEILDLIKGEDENGDN